MVLLVASDVRNNESMSEDEAEVDSEGQRMDELNTEFNKSSRPSSVETFRASPSEQRRAFKQRIANQFPGHQNCFSC